MAASASDFANALQYGPQARSAIRRSEYLASALEQLGKDSSKIQSAPELGARLLAQALLMRQNDKARDAVSEALQADREQQAAALLAGLSPPPGPGAEAAAPSPPPMPPAGLPGPPQPVQAAPLPAALPMGSAGVDPDTDAIVRTVWGEARGEGPVGQQGVAAVILNRGAERGLRPGEVVRQRGQFEPWGNPATRAKLTSLSPSSPEYQAILNNIRPVLEGQVPPQFQGADHFYSPTAQSALGRPAPAWDNGRGQDVGRHRFFDLEQARGGAQAGSAPGAAPFNVATLQLQPGMVPSAEAPVPAPSVGAVAPAASSPQAAAGVTTMPATPAEIEYAQRLLADPRTFAAGRDYVMKLQQRAVTPQELDTVSINGLPFNRNKFTGELSPIQVPDAARTQVMPAMQAGLPLAPPGAFVQRDPLGGLSAAPFAPPEGYGATAEGYAPIRGGPADPYAPQRPAQGYQYQGGAQVAIPGGPADPRNAQNVLDGTRTIRNEIAGPIDSALKLKRSVDSVRVGYSQQGGAGDIAMINGLQRMIDEGVVREGDVALQLRGQGLAGSISGLKGYMTSEGFFSDPKVRDAVMRTAESLFQQVNENYRQRVVGYRSIVDSTYGEGAFERYVFPPDMALSVGWGEASPQPPPPIDPSKMSPAEREALVRAAQEELRRRGVR